MVTSNFKYESYVTDLSQQVIQNKLVRNQEELYNSNIYFLEFKYSK